MIPFELPDSVRNDPNRSGEVAVFDALQGDYLLNGFTAWYSPKWLAGYKGALRDGEADFILASPKIGFLSIEVKGGRVKREILTGKWTSKNRNGQVVSIEDPIHQAMKSKKVLLNYLLKHWRGD